MDNEKKKYPIIRTPAATAAKNKYRDKTYDRMELAMPKGTKQNILEAVNALGYRSVNQFVEKAVISQVLPISASYFSITAFSTN